MNITANNFHHIENFTAQFSLFSSLGLTPQQQPWSYRGGDDDDDDDDDGDDGDDDDDKKSVSLVEETTDLRQVTDKLLYNAEVFQVRFQQKRPALIYYDPPFF